jgi:hypothetical protein
MFSRRGEITQFKKVGRFFNNPFIAVLWHARRRTRGIVGQNTMWSFYSRNRVLESNIDADSPFKTSWDSIWFDRSIRIVAAEMEYGLIVCIFSYDVINPKRSEIFILDRTAREISGRFPIHAWVTRALPFSNWRAIWRGHNANTEISLGGWSIWIHIGW